MLKFTLAMNGCDTPFKTPLMTPIVPMMVCSPNEEVAKGTSNKIQHSIDTNEEVRVQ